MNKDIELRINEIKEFAERPQRSEEAERAGKRAFEYICDIIEQKISACNQSEYKVQLKNALTVLCKAGNSEEFAYQVKLDCEQMLVNSTVKQQYYSGAVEYSECGFSNSDERKNIDLDKLIAAAVDYVNSSWKQERFSDIIIEYMIEKGLTNPEVYNAVDLDRRHFQRIINTRITCGVEKNTLIRIALGLHLNLTETARLLKSAGFALNDTPFDRVLSFCFENKIYDYLTVQYILDAICNSSLDERSR